MALDDVPDEVRLLINRIQKDMLAAATARRDAFIADCTTLEQVREAAQTGVARVPWDAVGSAGEQRLAADGITVRCLLNSDRTLPDSEDDAGVVAYAARAY